MAPVTPFTKKSASKQSPVAPLYPFEAEWPPGCYRSRVQLARGFNPPESPPTPKCPEAHNHPKTKRPSPKGPNNNNCKENMWAFPKGPTAYNCPEKIGPSPKDPKAETIHHVAAFFRCLRWAQYFKTISCKYYSMLNFLSLFKLILVNILVF